MPPTEPLEIIDTNIPVLTEIVRDAPLPPNTDRDALIAELQTKLAARTFALTDELLRSSFKAMEATLFEQISARLRSELPEHGKKKDLSTDEDLRVAARKVLVHRRDLSGAHAVTRNRVQRARRVRGSLLFAEARAGNGMMRFDRSNAIGRALHNLVPGGAHTYAKGDDQYPEGMAPIIVKGQGCRVWDADGNEFIEYGSGLRSVGLAVAAPH